MSRPWRTTGATRPVRRGGTPALLAALLATGSAAAAEYIPGTFPPLKAGTPYAGLTITAPTMKGWARSPRPSRSPCGSRS